MDRRDFNFDLPRELIAQRPLAERSASRLLALDSATGRIRDLRFPDLVDVLAPGDLLVLNDTRVLPARLIGRKESGGRVELLLERIESPRRARVQLKASHPPKAGQAIELPGGARAKVEGRDGPLFVLELDRDAEPYFLEHGLVPLPPYIDRPAEEQDQERYQTVFAQALGAVAAPTAGLHFDAALFDALDRRGIERAFLTLHVGAGTFSPVRTERIEEHRLHAERVSVPPDLAAAVARTRARGGRVVAVGTTVVRALESAARGARGMRISAGERQKPTADDRAARSAAGGDAVVPSRADGFELEPFEGETSLFIFPGYTFRVVDALVTNFHLPESSLLMLVAAFAGRERTLEAYRHAVAERYRFFSYGDAMFVTPEHRRAAEGSAHAV
jgi:S-adenosylmethionine:tRNA ribosyltransferase-isomerase